MARTMEIEIKLAASPAVLKALRSLPQLAGEDHKATLVTTYFDTVGGRLRCAGGTLRLRDTGQGREQTLKLASASGASIRRNEWNAPVAGDTPDLSGFPFRARSALARLLDGAALKPVAGTRVERVTRHLRYGGSVIELAFDSGAIEAGERRENLCELEMELVEGKLADVLALALELPLGPGLGWSVRSKGERCNALAFDMQPEAVHARPVKLSPSMHVARGFQTIAWHCLEQLLANYPLIIASGDPEGVHQARVAIRRLRAAKTLFGAVVDDEAGAVLHAELKAVASGLGPARDLHVLYERVAAAAAQGSHQDLTGLLAHLGKLREAAVRSAQALLAGEAFQRLLFRYAAWVEAGEWLGGDEGRQPLGPFAARILSQRRRKLRRVHGVLADLPDDVRHRLRIDAKKLRYATGFFEALHGDKAKASQCLSFAKSLGRLQDSLGELNDMVVAAAGQDALFADLDPIIAAGYAVQLDGLLASQAKSRRKLLKRAEQALEKVAEAPPWWKEG